MKSFVIKASLLGVLGALASGQAFAHQTYNITSLGSNGLGIANSVNNTDGISNFGGYSQGGGTAAPMHWIPGTGGLPADYTGALPYNWYAGHHDVLPTASTTRSQSTGTSEASTNSLWKAAYTDTTNTWAPYAPATTTAAATAQHPYLAVGGNSWVNGSTAGGLDYGLIHASGGANTGTQNNLTQALAIDPNAYYEIDITVKRDAAYNTASAANGNSSTSNLNDANALLDVALYRGADVNTNTMTDYRTAAFNPNAVGVQGSSLGTGGADGWAQLWTASQSLTSDVLTFALKINYAEWLKTDALSGGLNDGSAGYYTLLIGANGGAANSALAYTVDTFSHFVYTAPVPVPGAIWLFGSALGAFGAFGRRKAAQA